MINLDQNWDTLKTNCRQLASKGLSSKSLGDPSSPDADADFRDAFENLWGKDATITLSGATITVDDKQGTITITRPNTSFPIITAPGFSKDDPPDTVIQTVSGTLNAAFSISPDGKVNAKLELTLANPLSKEVFKTVFPSLPFAYEADNDGGPDAPKDVQPILHGETLTNVCLVITTHDAPLLRAGLNIRATWTPSPNLKPPQGKQLVLQGHIVFPDPHKPTPRLADGMLPWEDVKDQPLPPGLHLRADLEIPHPLWGDRKFDQPGFVFYSPLTRNWLLRNWGYEPRMAYTGNVTLGKNASGQGALVATTWDAFDSEVMLVCAFKNAAFGSPTEALALAAELLSAEAPKDNDFKDVKSTGMTLDRSFVRLVKGTPASIGLTLGLPAETAKWTTLGEHFGVALETIRIVVVKENSGLRVWGTLQGTLTLWDTPFNVSVEVPGFALRARQTTSLRLAKVLGSQFAQGFPSFSDVELDDVTLNLRPGFSGSPTQYDFSFRLKEGLDVSGVTAPYVQLSISNNEWSLYASAEEKGFSIDKLLESLAEKVVPTTSGETGLPKGLELPAAIQSFSVTSFTVRVRKGAQGAKNEYSFSCTGQIEVEGKQVRGGVNIDFAQDEKTYKGWLSLGTRMFSFTVHTSVTAGDKPASSDLVAAYTHWGGPVGLGELMGDLVDEGMASNLNKLKVDVKDAFFASTKSGTNPSNYFFGVDLGAKLDFKSLPLVGKYFTQDIGINNLQVIYAKAPFDAATVARIDPLLPQNVAKKPANGTAPNPGGVAGNPATAIALNQGLNIAADLNLGFTAQPLAFPTSTSANTTLTPGTGATVPVPPQASTTDNAIWLNIQKSFGPVHFERVGFEYRAPNVFALLSASLVAAGLTISLDGLGLGLDPATRHVTPSLRGLGLDYRNAFVEIGGSFLQMPPKKKDDAPEYSGAAVIKAQGFTIGALGSYTTVNEETSFFIYGMLDYPIGGPPFFFVTGLAAGFGYNRNVVVPPIERLGQFPLIAAAKSIADGKSNAGAQDMLPVLRNARDAIPATVGEHFLAAGITFTSFKLVESTVLLTVAFGKRFELHILGLSTLRVPAAELGESLPAIAEVELALKGSFIPDDGFLELRAQLTPTSYLLSRDCHLTGGFAFCTWFKGLGAIPAGDFVLTLGGYHPAYHVPKHYPIVPRLGFHWSLQNWGLTLQGDSYFALTSSAVMAGGHLLALWQSGSISAWFKAGIDFLIAWKPYHYDAEAYIDIGVQVTFEFFGTQRLSLEVGADLHIWGPPFAGEATVHLWIISFTIHFGDSEKSKPQPIPWSDFQKSFLPDRKQVCSVVVADGLVRKGVDKNDLGIINAKHFRLVTDSRIPSTACVVVPVDPEGVPIALKGMDTVTRSFGIAPMGVENVTSSTHTITIKRITGPTKTVVCTEIFAYTAIGKNVPAALWGSSLTPQLHGPQFVNNALCGFEITTRKPETTHTTADIDRAKLLVNRDAKPHSCQWGEAGKGFTARPKGDQDAVESFDKDKRNQVLECLGLQFPDLADKLDYDFIKPPQIEAA